jgi:hypothetical protein
LRQALEFFFNVLGSDCLMAYFLLNEEVKTHQRLVSQATKLVPRRLMVKSNLTIVLQATKAARIAFFGFTTLAYVNQSIAT